MKSDLDTASNHAQSISKDHTQTNRNYELDFFRLVFALLIFVNHTSDFIKEEMSFLSAAKLAAWGGFSVHFFFVLSGLMMANSISKKNVNGNYGKASIGFVLNKFKAVVWQLWTAIAIYLGGYTVYMIFKNPKEIIPMYIKIFPELFMVTNSGIMIEYLKLAWYISAMLICMLPLAYMLYRNSDLTINVLAPLTALLTLGYMCQTSGFSFIDRLSFSGLVMGGLIRAVCGICFGICSYAVYNKLRRIDPNKHLRVLLTATEILLYTIIFFTLFFLPDNQAVMSIVLILPIAMAITFSEKSCLVKVFRSDKMRFFAPLSLLIYLDHGIAHAFVKVLFIDKSWKFCVTAMTLMTAAFCLLNLLIVHFGRKLWKEKIKPFFTNPDSI